MLCRPQIISRAFIYNVSERQGLYLPCLVTGLVLIMWPRVGLVLTMSGDGACTNHVAESEACAYHVFGGGACTNHVAKSGVCIFV